MCGGASKTGAKVSWFSHQSWEADFFPTKTGCSKKISTYPWSIVTDPEPPVYDLGILSCWISFISQVCSKGPSDDSWMPLWEIPAKTPCIMCIYVFSSPIIAGEHSKYHGYTVRGTPNCLLIVLRRFQHTPGTYPKRPWTTCLDFIHIWGMFQGPVGTFLMFLFLVGLSTPDTQCTLEH